MDCEVVLAKSKTINRQEEKDDYSMDALLMPAIIKTYLISKFVIMKWLKDYLNDGIEMWSHEVTSYI